jgi:multidrug resistance efflux pump
MLAVVIYFVLRATNTGPLQAESNEAPLAVRAIRINTDKVVPRYTAMGVVQSPRSWNAVAQVGGEVEYRSSNTEVGRFVEAGEILLRIDREEYEIAVRQIKAATTETKARMENLDVKEASTLKLVEVERESLELLESNYIRTRETLDRGAASPGEVDDARREYLSQLARVTDLESVLNGYPSDRAALEATLEVNQAELANAQLALSRTELKAPFSGRVTEVVAEEAEFVSVGQQLFPSPTSHRPKSSSTVRRRNSGIW